MMGAFLPAMTQRMLTGVYALDNVGLLVGLDRHDRRADHRLPRRGPAGGRGGHRARHGPLRGGDRHGPGRAPAAQPGPPLPRGLHDRHRHVLRRGRLPGGAAAGPRARGLRRAAGRAGRSPGRGRCRADGHRPVVLRRDHRRRAVVGVRLGRAARRRADPGHHRGHALRSGPRDGVGDDRGRPDRRGHGRRRGRQGRHRPGARRRSHRRLAVGPAGRRRGGRRVAEADRCGPPGGGRAPRGRGRRRGAGPGGRPVPRGRRAEPVGRLGRPGRPRPPAPDRPVRLQRVVADVPLRRPRGRGRGGHR